MLISCPCDVRWAKSLWVTVCISVLTTLCIDPPGYVWIPALLVTFWVLFTCTIICIGAHVIFNTSVSLRTIISPQF
ncbi:hypothetical protein BU16DRAFT_287987 [Lophium mytilinum]|uniref:Uncharacterized protein n=1 Tax=Lophium mytilinum TaxID=390894 RepID=A0A6A6R141_9PEZI|nr:hypothetical protein BU16DRAFT_287987 [Lophium mytilinum]